MIVNPTMAEDVEVLERYFSSSTTAPALTTKPYSRVSHSSGESVIYLRLPRRRPRLQNNAKVAGTVQREIMKQVLHTCEGDVVNL
jgi:hypothetical protein